MTTEVTLAGELIQNDYEYIGKRWLSLTAEEQVNELNKKFENISLIAEMYLRSPEAVVAEKIITEVKYIADKALRGEL